MANEPRAGFAKHQRSNVSLLTWQQLNGGCCWHGNKHFRNTIWPGGVRPHHGSKEELDEGEEEGRGERERMLRSVLVRAKLIGTVPDDLRRLLGSRRTTQGMARFVQCLQKAKHFLQRNIPPGFSFCR